MLDAPSLFRFSGAARIPSTFHLFYVRAVTGLHCLGFNVFDFVASCNGWVSGAAGATSVVLGHLGPGCLCITWALAKNNLVPTVTLGFGNLVPTVTVGSPFAVGIGVLVVETAQRHWFQRRGRVGPAARRAASSTEDRTLTLIGVSGVGRARTGDVPKVAIVQTLSWGRRPRCVHFVPEVEI